MVEEFFRTILSGDKLEPTPEVRDSFIARFPDAVSVEWYNHGNVFEAIFFDEQIEKITSFNKNGEWMETKLNLSLETLSPHLITELTREGEIMSSIMIHQPDLIMYEFVVRDKEMNRQLIFTDEEGKIIRKRKFINI
jgi:hypothetical protein